MTNIVDWETWKKRVESLKAGSKGNPTWERFILEQHGLEIAYVEMRQRMRRTGRFGWPPATAENFRFCCFAVTASRVHASLSDAGKARLSGAIRSALRGDRCLAPIEYEMRMAAHAMARGFDVEFHDMETGGGHDFIAGKDAAEIEVECKHVSADLGRQIHRRDLQALIQLVAPAINRAVANGTTGQFLHVTLPGRLTRERHHQQALADRIEAALSGTCGSDVSDDAVCTVRSQEFDLNASPFRSGAAPGQSDDELEKFVEHKFGLINLNTVANVSPGRSAVVISFESEQPDQVLKRTFENLSDDASRQFSGTRPAILLVHLADIKEPHLRELSEIAQSGTLTGLQQCARDLLDRRPHLHSLALTADGEVEFSQREGLLYRERIGRERGPTYRFKNPTHPDYADATIEGLFEMADDRR